MSEYTEGPGSVFEQDGVKYSVDKMLAVVKDWPPSYYSISAFDWFATPTELSKLDPHRVQNASLDYPVIVAPYKGRFVVVDGMHRLAKAKLLKKQQIKAKFISESELESCKV